VLYRRVWVAYLPVHDGSVGSGCAFDAFNVRVESAFTLCVRWVDLVGRLTGICSSKVNSCWCDESYALNGQNRFLIPLG
jgi:hypothetical protein